MVSAIYGFFYVAVKLLLVEVSAESLLWLRFVLSAMILMPIEWLVFKSRIPLSDMLKIIGLSLLGVYLVQMALVVGVGMTTSFYASLVMASVPIITLLMGILFRKEFFRWQKLLGMLLGFTGVAVVLSAKSAGTHLAGIAGQTVFQGNLYVIGAALCFALFLFLSQSLLKRYRAFTVTAYSYLVSAIAISLPYNGFFLDAPGAPMSSVDYLVLSPKAWALLAFIVIGASILTYLLNNYALKRTSPTVVSVYMFLAPVQAAIWGYWILGEPFTLWMGIAALLTFTGIIIANQSPDQQVDMTSIASQDALIDLNQPEIEAIARK